MAEEEKHVKIISWPEEPAKLEHKFKVDKPCPVSISFEKSPANVFIHTTPEKPLHVDMAMNVVAKETIPVCIKLCEPICAKSDYTIGIDIFDRPVAAITIRGMTRLFSCGEESQPQLICTSFKNLKEGTEFSDSLSLESLLLSPLGGNLHIATFGEPAGQMKLAFPPTGVKVGFPYPVDYVRLNVGNYAGEKIDFVVFSGGTVTQELTEQIVNGIKVIQINQPETTSVVVKGGRNEANLVEVCYR